MGRVISWPKSFVCLTRNSTVTPPGSKTATARSSTCSARFLTWPTTTPPLGNLLNGPSPAYFSFIFGSFQANNNTIFTANSCEKYPSSIWRWDSNTQPSGHESPPLTTRQGLSPKALLPSVCMNFIFQVLEDPSLRPFFPDWSASEEKITKNLSFIPTTFGSEMTS